ncbi:MAG: 4-(cytidine 5'-diphospho)-2-C-methyl-D-erythritol kinase [Clostridia bacterium]|jgi:4-diphosphocytidyl-2-C-methyl-D-erythritol kinase|nr:4-(cytidine 5'-diphospho)-2-C-methyl-D-erythritol kinase [Clostridia bacterium]
MRKIIVKAFAKINLSLNVLRKRADGFHEVDMVMQGISLHDVVEITNALEGVTLTCNLPELETGEENLACRAALLLQKKYLQARGLKIHLHKNIPLAAGLAGGSSDAAAVLAGVNALYQLGLNQTQLEELGAQIGSDVPFCLNPLTARARGRGEIIESLPVCPPLSLVLLKPSFGVATGDVYRHLSKVTVQERPETQKVISALEKKQRQNLLSALGNVLEYATFDLHPVLRELRQEMLDQGASQVLMSGSGPTLLGFAPGETAVKELGASLRQAGREIFICRTLLPEDLAERIRRE